MSMRFELFQRRLEKIFDNDEEEAEERRFDIMNRKVFQWLFRSLLSILFLVLIINVALMFATPVKIIKSEWFWLKDPLSIVAGYAIFRIFRRLFLRYKSSL